MPARRTSALHANRWSVAGARYFVTCCTFERHQGLLQDQVAAAVRSAAARLDEQDDVVSLALTVMPDHVHWLLQLGSRLSLGRVVGRFKADTRVSLLSAGLAWQRDFFEHRLRAEESVEDYGRYIFLNPYRAGLVAATDVWRSWWCPHPALFRFSGLLHADATPPREWINEKVGADLAVGE